MPEYCKVCGVKIEEKDGELINAKCLKFKEGEDEYYTVRCNACFVKDPALHNFRKCEVYSRTCGYYRPVQQWHDGKQQEFKDRLEFTEPIDSAI
jgi:anaerobic ribonucleoside-triphosphate reductase